MINNPSVEFLKQIELVVDDGELSFKEIRNLAKWVNANKHCIDQWPVDMFVPLLRDVFADGKIDRTEAREVARLVQAVHRIWIRDLKPKPDLTEQEKVALALREFESSSSGLPSLPIQLDIKSHSSAGVSYVVDLSGPSCTCPDFRGNRKGLSVGDISRCCKHVMEAYAQLRPEDGWPDWLDSFLEAGFRPKPKQKWQIVNMTNPTENWSQAVLISSAEPEWSNLYAKIDGKNVKYGYSIDDDRWSYGDEPEHAKKLAKLMRKLSGK